MRRLPGHYCQHNAHGGGGGEGLHLVWSEIFLISVSRVGCKYRNIQGVPNALGGVFKYSITCIQPVHNLPGWQLLYVKTKYSTGSASLSTYKETWRNPVGKIDWVCFLPLFYLRPFNPLKISPEPKSWHPVHIAIVLHCTPPQGWIFLKSFPTKTPPLNCLFICCIADDNPPPHD